MNLPTVVTNDIETLRRCYVPTRRCASCIHLQTEEVMARITATCGLKVWEERGDKAACDLAEVTYGNGAFDACDRFQWQPMSDEEFVQRGVELVSMARVCYILLGELIAWKIEREQVVTHDSRRAIIEHYSAAWGVSQSSLWKAWVLVAKFPALPRPEDAPPTLAYEVLAGCDTEEEAGRVLDLALGGGWSVNDLREIKALRTQGLLADWQRLRLVRQGNMVMVTDGTESVPVAVLAGRSPLARAGAALLRMRGGF